MYQDDIIPPNISEDVRNEIDDFNEVFVSYNTDDEDSIIDQEMNDYCGSSKDYGEYEDDEDLNESWYVNLEEDYFEEESNNEEILVISESETDSDTERDSDKNEETTDPKINSKRKKIETGYTKKKNVKLKCKCCYKNSGDKDAWISCEKCDNWVYGDCWPKGLRPNDSFYCSNCK